MANKRMFNIFVIDSDAFLDMPLSAQALYFHLNMRADDDGFIGNPKRIQRLIGASSDDLKLLIAKRFLLLFDDGVIVIKHWRMHNTIRKDRYTETVYTDEKDMLKIKENKSYSLENGTPIKALATDWQPNGTTDIGIDIDIDKGIDKDKGKRENTRTVYERLIGNYSISEYLGSKVSEWITYKMERKESYKEQGMKSLLRQIEKNAVQYGDEAIVNLIDECMAANWKGIIWDKLKKKQEHVNNNDRIASRVSDVDNW